MCESTPITPLRDSSGFAPDSPGVAASTSIHLVLGPDTEPTCCVCVAHGTPRPKGGNTPRATAYAPPGDGRRGRPQGSGGGVEGRTGRGRGPIARTPGRGPPPAFRGLPGAHREGVRRRRETSGRSGTSRCVRMEVGPRSRGFVTPGERREGSGAADKGPDNSPARALRGGLRQSAGRRPPGGGGAPGAVGGGVSRGVIGRVFRPGARGRGGPGARGLRGAMARMRMRMRNPARGAGSGPGARPGPGGGAAGQSWGRLRRATNL